MPSKHLVYLQNREVKTHAKGPNVDVLENSENNEYQGLLQILTFLLNLTSSPTLTKHTCTHTYTFQDLYRIIQRLQYILKSSQLGSHCCVIVVKAVTCDASIPQGHLFVSRLFHF